MATYEPTGLGTSPFTALGADATTWAKTGFAGISPRVASGADVDQWTKTGVGISAFVAKATDATTTIETGIAISERTVRALRARVVNKAGTNIALDATASGFKTEATTTRLVIPTDVPVYPKTCFYGTHTNPFMINTTTGKELKFYDLSCINGDLLEIDHAARSVTKNGAAVYGYRGDFFPVASVNDMQVGADSIGAGFYATMTTPAVGGVKTRSKYGRGIIDPHINTRPLISVSRNGVGMMPLSTGGVGGYYGPTPANDDLVNAILIADPITYGNYTYITDANCGGATSEPTSNRPLLSDSAARSVWYKVTPLATGYYYFYMYGYTGPKPAVGIYSGASSDALTVLYENNDPSSGNPAYLYTTFNSGTTYYIAIIRYQYVASNVSFEWGRFV